MNLYEITRAIRTGQIIASGNPKRIANRFKNIAVGRLLARSGVWRALWRPW